MFDLPRGLGQTLMKPLFGLQRGLRKAARWLATLFDKVESLENQPERCPLADEADALGIELRELLFGRSRSRFRILFIIEGTTVQILHIRRAVRDSLKPEDL
jgi:hypothetical protein